MTSPSSSAPPPLPRAAVPGLVQDVFAALLSLKGCTADAIDQRRAAIQKLEEVLGPDHPELQPSLEQLAVDLLRLDDFAAAAVVLRRTYDYLRSHRGEENPETMKRLAELTECLVSAEDFASARPFLEHRLKLSERMFGPDHEHVLNTGYLLAKVHLHQGERMLAEAFLRKTQEGFERTLGPDHPKTAASLYSLFEHLSEDPDPASAGPLGEKLFSTSTKLYGYSHPLTISAAKLVAEFYMRRQNYAAAAALLRRATAAFPTTRAPMNLEHARLQSLLAAFLDLEGNSTEAEALARSALYAFHTHLGPDDDETRTVQRHVADMSIRRYSQTWLGRFRLRCLHIIGRLLSSNGKREA